MRNGSARIADTWKIERNFSENIFDEYKSGNYTFGDWKENGNVREHLHVLIGYFYIYLLNKPIDDNNQINFINRSDIKPILKSG